MGLFNMFDVAGSAMSAQTVRLNTTASNLANAQSVSSSINETYKARHPVFSTASSAFPSFDDTYRAEGVRVLGIVESTKEPMVRHEPENPLADENGNVFLPNINVVEEMTNMITASRNFQMNVNVAVTAKELVQRLLTLGQG